jgi:hypothetical protein
MSGVELFWIPLGAGGWFVRTNGIVFEFVAAAIGRRPRSRLFHSALVVEVDGVRHAIELCPEQPGRHGRVAGGPVGARWAGRWRIFRYEARCWPDGSIPDARFAIESPVLLSADPRVAREIISQAPRIPTPVWGRDELRVGEMWNSNSVISWLLERAGLAAGDLKPPQGGRAPGWMAGLRVARRTAQIPSSL